MLLLLRVLMLSNFTRIYGHETGKKYDLDSNTSTPSVFVVRPGFDSNMVQSDNRLSPNETETYTLTYDITGKTGVSATYKIYYMQKGANGKFIVDPATGFLDQAASDAKKLLVTEVGSLYCHSKLSKTSLFHPHLGGITIKST